MNRHYLKILNTLKNTFQYESDGYSQWIAAVSLKENSTVNQLYQLRIIILTSSSPYLDGTDLVVTVGDDAAILEEDVFGETPLLQGSPMIDALNWIRSYGPLINWQSDSPF